MATGEGGDQMNKEVEVVRKGLCEVRRGDCEGGCDFCEDPIPAICRTKGGVCLCERCAQHLERMSEKIRALVERRVIGNVL